MRCQKKKLLFSLNLKGKKEKKEKRATDACFRYFKGQTRFSGFFRGKASKICTTIGTCFFIIFVFVIQFPAQACEKCLKKKTHTPF